MNFNFGNRFNEDFQKELEEKQFPFKKLSERWLDFAYKSLRFASPITLGIQSKELKALMDSFHKKKLTFYQFALLSNNLEARTPNELNLGMEEYADLMLETNELSTIWNEATAEMRAELTKKLQEEMQMKAAAEKSEGPSKLTKAEA